MARYEVNFKDVYRKSIFKCEVEVANVFIATEAAFNKLSGQGILIVSGKTESVTIKRLSV